MTDLSTDHGPDTRGGTAYGAGAYAIWGAFPLYFALLAPAGAWEILAHRILRTLLFCAAVLAARREFAWCRSCSTTRMCRVPWNFGGGPLIVRPR